MRPSVRPYVRTYVRPYRNCIARAWVYVQPVGSTQGNTRAPVDLPAGLMLINTHAQVDVG